MFNEMFDLNGDGKLDTAEQALEFMTFMDIMDGPDDDDDTVKRRLMQHTLRTLKEMKGRGAIQLYAARESFLNLTTEAQYLINKYPELFEDVDYECMSAYSLYAKL